MERNSLYTGRRPCWQPSVLRVCSLHGLLLKIRQNGPIFHPYTSIIKSQESKKQANTSNFFLSSSPNYLLFTMKGYLITLAGFSGSEYWWVQSLETQPNVHASPRWSDFIFYYSQARAVMYQLRLYSFLLHKSSLISQLIGGKQTHS